jgi:hypothetical protein
MDGARLARLRWRLRGAWKWPTFATMTVVDAFVGHALPPAGETQSVVAAALDGLVLNLLGVLLLGRPLGSLVRRVRRDLPAVVARDYASAWVVVAIAAALLAVGLRHQGAIQADVAAMREASARAQAWIGDHAPTIFQRELPRIDVVGIQPGSVYRACVPSASGARTYCVVVDVERPWARSVRFAGYESNSLFSRGMG